MNTKAILKTCYNIEAVAATYTRKTFLKFQEELFFSQKLKIAKLGENDGEKTYRVKPYENETSAYDVVFSKSDNKAIYSCHMFEFVGILCKHIFAIFVKKSLVEEIDSQYILKRWTMNAKKGVGEGIFGDVIQCERQASIIYLRNNLMVQFSEVVEHGSKSRLKYEYLSASLQKLHKELLTMSDDERDTILKDGDLQDDTQSQSDKLLANINSILNDPLHVPTKGRPKSLRHKNPKENHSTKRKKCSVCKMPGHTKKTCQNKQASDASPSNQEINLQQESLATSLSSSFIVSQNTHPQSYTDLMKQQHWNVYRQQ